MTGPEIFDKLLPQPQSVTAHEGDCDLRGGFRESDGLADRRVQRALAEWRKTLDKISDTTGAWSLRVEIDRSACPHRQGYRLLLRPQRVTLVGGSPAGCFYGVQTLMHLIDSARGRPPCCTIVDEPDFETRGILHDITRGKVPTLGTLKGMVDRLATAKINQLQLYIEHAFVFRFDSQICCERDGITPDEVGELDRYCKARFIDLVPAVANLGHMGRILSMPQYRHLSEVETGLSWAEMSWPQRARGLTLNAAHPEAKVLVEQIWSEILEAFSSPVVNLCGDEPHDLGKGKNAEKCQREGLGALYGDHLRRVHHFCTRRGRKTQCWSDVLIRHRELLETGSRGITVLHWGYNDESDYAATETLVQSGWETIVCPGTMGWKRVLNAMGLAERNIAAFTAAGKAHGAKGVLTTDWGDHGHFNMIACSWHAMILAAAKSWNVRQPIGRTFDESFAQQGKSFLDHEGWSGESHGKRKETILRHNCATPSTSREDATGIALLREASAIADRSETWRLLWMPLAAIREDTTLPEREQAEQAISVAREARRWWADLESSGRFALDTTELVRACRFTELVCEKILFAHRLRKAEGDSPSLASEKRDWAERLRIAAQDYAEGWLARNKPGGLADILRALDAAGQEIRDRGRCVKGAR